MRAAAFIAGATTLITLVAFGLRASAEIDGWHETLTAVCASLVITATVIGGMWLVFYGLGA